MSFNELKDILLKQFVELNKIKRQKFLKYVVTVPDFSEAKDIENYLDKIYLNNDDEGEKGAEDLLKMVLTLTKDHKITFVEYLTSQLNDEDSDFVFSFLGSHEAGENIYEDMEINVGDSEVDLSVNVIKEETSDVILNELSDCKADEDTKEVMELERTRENRNDFDSDQEDLLDQFFKLQNVSREKFLKYLLLVPDIVEKKDIESFLDSVYLNNNEGDYTAEDFLKIVLNLENNKKSTFVEHLMRRLSDENTAFISGILTPNLEEEENITKDMDMEDIHEKNDFLLNKVTDKNGIGLQVVLKEKVDLKADCVLNAPDYKSYFESDNLLIKMRPKVENIKNEFDQKINNKTYERANIDTKDVKHPNDPQRVYIKSEKEEDFKPDIVKESSKYFENDNLLIKVKKGLPLDIENKMGSKSRADKNTINYKNKSNSKIKEKMDSKRTPKEVLKPCPDKVFNFKCEQCYVGTETEEGLHEHKIVSHYNEKEGETLISKSTICDICSKQFKFPSVLRYHKTMVHSTERTFLCDQCSKTYKISTHLKEHKHIVHEGGRKNKGKTDEISIVCEYCSKIFKARGNLTQHIKLIHLEEYAFKCAKCDKSFNRKNSLEQHELNIHKESKNFPCDQCPKLFPSAKRLKQHMKIHEGKIYPCKQCGKNFQLISNLKVHERLHSGELPHTCDICQKRFNQKTNLMKHKKVHTSS